MPTPIVGSKIKMANRAEAAILAVHAQYVRSRYNKGRMPLRYNLDHLLPVRCLFCCAGVGGNIIDRIRFLLLERLGPETVSTDNPPHYVRLVADSMHAEIRDDRPLFGEDFEIVPPKYVTVILDDRD